MNKITSINGMPCNLVKAEIAEELLSALKKAKDWIDGDASIDMDDHDHAVYNETVDIINAAIKKATQS